MNYSNGLKQHIGYWVDRLRSKVHTCFEERLTSYNVTVASWCIMIVIYEEKAYSINQLARYIQVDKATISRVVNELVNKGLLVHTSGKDRRSGKIELTLEGKNLVPLLMQEAEQNEQQFFGHLTDLEKDRFQHIMHSIIANIPNVTLEGWLLCKNSTEENMKNIEQIIIRGRIGEMSFPKMFQDLKNAGVNSYIIYIEDNYQGIFEGTFGTWKEPELLEYSPLSIMKKFSVDGIKNALVRRSQSQTNYFGFLSEIAANGVSHYKADMENYTVTYFSPDETQFYEQNVPILNE